MKIVLVACMSMVGFAYAGVNDVAEGRATIQRNVMEKLVNDRVAMEHFFLIGRMRCYKELNLGNKSKVDYEMRWLRGGMLNYPLVSLMKPQNVIGFFDKDMRERIKKKRKQIALRAEHFYTSPYNGVLICESLHRLSDENIQRYREFVQDANNYLEYEVYKSSYEGYLKNITYNNNYW